MIDQSAGVAARRTLRPSKPPANQPPPHAAQHCPPPSTRSTWPELTCFRRARRRWSTQRWNRQPSRRKSLSSRRDFIRAFAGKPHAKLASAGLTHSNALAKPFLARRQRVITVETFNDLDQRYPGGVRYGNRRGCVEFTGVFFDAAEKISRALQFVAIAILCVSCRT